MKTEQEWRERYSQLYNTPKMSLADAALQLGREMADERAAEIARRLFSESDRAENVSGERTGYVVGMDVAGEIARSTITKPEPKTKTQVLREALEEIRLRYELGTQAATIARCALAWKPEESK